MPCFLQTLCTFALANSTRGVAQLVSAPRSGRGGRKFESSHPDKKSDNLRLSLFLYLVVYQSFRAHLIPHIKYTAIPAHIIATSAGMAIIAYCSGSNGVTQKSGVSTAITYNAVDVRRRRRAMS